MEILADNGALEELSPQNLNAIVACAIAVGTLYCFLGYRTLKIVIALTGFIMAGAVGGALAAWISQSHTVATLVGAGIGGIAGALALFFLYKAGIFVLGFLAATMIGLNTVGVLDESWAPWAVLGIGVGGGIVALLLERLMMTLATAALGAWIVVSGLAFFVLGPPLLRTLEPPIDLSGHEGALLLAWVILAAGGAIMQFATHKSRRPSVAHPMR